MVERIRFWITSSFAKQMPRNKSIVMVQLNFCHILTSYVALFFYTQDVMVFNLLYKYLIHFLINCVGCLF